MGTVSINVVSNNAYWLCMVWSVSNTKECLLVKVLTVLNVQTVLATNLIEMWVFLLPKIVINAELWWLESNVWEMKLYGWSFQAPCASPRPRQMETLLYLCQVSCFCYSFPSSFVLIFVFFISWLLFWFLKLSTLNIIILIIHEIIIISIISAALHPSHVPAIHTSFYCHLFILSLC